MQSNFERVREFHKAFNLLISQEPIFPGSGIRELRLGLIEEELQELKDAQADGDVVGVADALTDLLYVIYGMGLCYGIDLDACFTEVHRSNMTKLGDDGKPLYRESDGKVLKGPDYQPPNLVKVLFDCDLKEKA